MVNQGMFYGAHANNIQDDLGAPSLKKAINTLYRIESLLLTDSGLYVVCRRRGRGTFRLIKTRWTRTLSGTATVGNFLSA